jgi:hypothetical protein
LEQERRVVQLGIKGLLLEECLDRWIVRIDDITAFVAEQRGKVGTEFSDGLTTPAERPYAFLDPALPQHIGLTSGAGGEAEAAGGAGP